MDLDRDTPNRPPVCCIAEGEPTPGLTVGSIQVVAQIARGGVEYATRSSDRTVPAVARDVGDEKREPGAALYRQHAKSAK